MVTSLLAIGLDGRIVRALNHWFERSSFRTDLAKHLASWVGLCPGNRQSGGKRLSGKPTKGNVWLRAVLSEDAWATAHTKDNYLAAQ